MIRPIPPELLPLFNAALSCLYPSARVLEPDHPFPETTYGTFALFVYELSLLPPEEREAYVTARIEEARAHLASVAEAAARERAYQLEGRKQSEALAAVERKKLTDSLLLDLNLTL